MPKKAQASPVLAPPSLPLFKKAQASPSPPANVFDVALSAPTSYMSSVRLAPPSAEERTALVAFNLRMQELQTELAAARSASPGSFPHPAFQYIVSQLVAVF